MKRGNCCIRSANDRRKTSPSSNPGILYQGHLPQDAHKLDAFGLTAIATVETLGGIIPVLVNPEAFYRSPRAIQIYGARRRRRSKRCFVQIVLHSPIARECGIARRNSWFVDKEIRPYRIERNWIL